MPKQNKTCLAMALALAACTMAGTAFAQSAATQDSVVTVDQLLKLDNAAARDKAKRDAIAQGITTEAPQMPVVPRNLTQPPAQFSVQSITGVGNGLTAKVTYNGMQIPDVQVGSTVGRCTVKEIRGTAVVLEDLPVPQPAPSKKGKKSAPAPKLSPGQCPTGVWTGEGRPVAFGGGEASMGRPIPSDMPTSMRAPGAPAMVPPANMAPGGMPPPAGVGIPGTYAPQK